jgi:anti-sigma regulatory factor (Ser/Thr protein kinase)
VAVIRATLDPGTDAPGSARRLLERAASDLPKRVQQDAQVIVSEIVTTTVLHCSWDHRYDIVLDVVVLPDTLRVEVSDRCPRIANQQPDLSTLRLIGQFATRWGSEQRDDLHMAWFEIDVPPDGSSN